MGSEDREGCERRAAKRPRLEGPAASEERGLDEDIEHILYIRWFGNAGQTKLNKLLLRKLDSFESLQDLPKELVESHYPTATQMPDYFTNADFTRFTPQEECLALPGDVVRTELRLALCYRGWEYTILKRDSSQGGGLQQQHRGEQHNIHVMTAEFMGSDPLMAALGLRISLIAYPVVALRKVFLEDAHERLLAAPEHFKGML